MSKILYAFKLFVFKKQFRMNSTEINGLRYICLFPVNFYVVSWFDAPCAIISHCQDLNMVKNLYKFRSVHKKISDEATKVFSRKLWCVSKELVGLALFDDRVFLQIKKQTVAAVKTRESIVSNSKRFIVEDLSVLLSKNISDCASRRSLLLFEQFQLPY